MVLSGTGELRACSFCASVFHDTPECLGEQRSSATSHVHEAFAWCCPKCFTKGITAWGKKKVSPKGPAKRKPQAGKRKARK